MSFQHLCHVTVQYISVLYCTYRKCTNIFRYCTEASFPERKCTNIFRYCTVALDKRDVTPSIERDVTASIEEKGNSKLRTILKCIIC